MKRITDQLLFDYLEGNLDQRRSRELEALARDDQELQRRIAAQRRLQDRLKSTFAQVDRVSLGRIPPALREGRPLRQAGGPRRGGRRLAPVLAILLAALFLGGGSWWAGRNWVAITGGEGSPTAVPALTPSPSAVVEAPGPDLTPTGDPASPSPSAVVEGAGPDLTPTGDPASATPAPPSPPRQPSPTPNEIPLPPLPAVEVERFFAPSAGTTFGLEPIGSYPALAELGPRTIAYQTRERDLVLHDLERERVISLYDDLKPESCNPTRDTFGPTAQWSFERRFLSIVCEGASETIRTVIADMQSGELYHLRAEDKGGRVLWSPVEQRLLFLSTPAFSGPPGLASALVNMEARAITPLVRSDVHVVSAGWSGDGSSVALSTMDPSGQTSLYLSNAYGNAVQRLPLPGIVRHSWHEQVGEKALRVLWSASPYDLEPDPSDEFSAWVDPHWPGPFVLLSIAVDDTAQGPSYGGASFLSPAVPHAGVYGIDLLGTSLRSPDGRWMLWTDNRAGRPGNLMITQSNGEAEALYPGDPEREDWALAWLPDSSGVVRMARRPPHGVEVLLAALPQPGTTEGQEQLIASFPGVGLDIEVPLDVSGDGALIFLGLSDGRIAVITREGEQVRTFDAELQR